MRGASRGGAFGGMLPGRALSCTRSEHRPSLAYPKLFRGGFARVVSGGRLFVEVRASRPTNSLAGAVFGRFRSFGMEPIRWRQPPGLTSLGKGDEDI